MPWLLWLALVAVFALVIGSAVRIVRPYERGLVERLGKYHRTVEPGLRLIWPFIDRLVKVDMRERVIDVPPQRVITEDNVVVEVDAVVYYRVLDPVKVVYNVQRRAGADPGRGGGWRSSASTRPPTSPTRCPSR